MLEVIKAKKFEDLTDKVNKFYSSDAHSGIMNVSYDANEKESIALIDYTPRQEEEIPQTGYLKEKVEILEKREILRTLSETGGDKNKAAKRLGMSRYGLLHKIRRYEIEEEKVLPRKVKCISAEGLEKLKNEVNKFCNSIAQSQVLNMFYHVGQKESVALVDYIPRPQKK